MGQFWPLYILLYIIKWNIYFVGIVVIINNEKFAHAQARREGAYMDRSEILFLKIAYYIDIEATRFFF